MGSFFDIFKGRPDRAVGIDIGSSSIKVVELQRKGQFVELVTYGLLETGPYGGREIGRVATLTTERTAEALKDVMRESRVSTNVSGIAIPFRSSFMRLIDLPQVTESELDRMVPIEARKYVPVPIGEVSLDWALVPQIIPQMGALQSTEQQVHVFLIAIHNDILSRFKDISTGATLDNRFYEVEAYSSMRSVLSVSNEAIMLCDIGASSTKTYITYKGYIIATHIINAGAEDMTLALSKSFGITIGEAEAMKREKGLTSGKADDLTKSLELVLQRIITDLIRAKEDFESKYKTNITKVILVGGGAQLKGLPEAIEEKIKIETKKGNGFSQVKTPAFLTDTVAEIGPEFSVATGCALRAILGER